LKKIDLLLRLIQIQHKSQRIIIMTSTEQPPKLTFIISDDMGKCGLKNHNKKQIYFPFFMMGCCGDARGVISWNGEREILQVPKKMDYKWFKILAEKLRENPYFDWDWESFSKNILAPNREHLKIVLKLDDEAVDMLLEDGYVFINNFDGKPEDDGEDSTEWEKMRLKGENGYYPNFKNFLEHPNELEY
jgi:hypothetical protein